MIEAVTDNNNRTAPEIRHIFSKAGLELGTPGSAAWAFTKTSEGYVPNNPMELDDDTGEKLADFIEKLEEQDDVTNVYTAADSLEDPAKRPAFRGRPLANSKINYTLTHESNQCRPGYDHARCCSYGTWKMVMKNYSFLPASKPTKHFPSLSD